MMKKTLHILCIAAVFAALTASCKKEEDPVFSISDNTAIFSATESNRVIINVTTNLGLEVTSAPDWITPILTPVKIEPGAVLAAPVTIKLTLIASDSKLHESRSGNIVLSGIAREGFTRTVSVSQGGRPYAIKYTITGIYSCLPLFYGSDLSASIEWGDGNTTAYSEGETHKYSKYGEHTISIVMDKGTSEKVRFEGIKEITGIDLSSF